MPFAPHIAFLRERIGHFTRIRDALSGREVAFVR
jgi:hypothetical protein